MKSLNTLIFTLSTFIFVLWCTARIYNDVQFNIHCGGYLERASYANTIELASPALTKAIQYVENNGLTNGFTSIIYRTPDEDMGFWYSNLKQAEDELSKIKPDSTALEKSNVLMKLRESLTSHNSEGSQLICPDGISIYPLNALYCFAGWMSGLLLCISGLLLCITGTIWFIKKTNYDW